MSASLDARFGPLLGESVWHTVTVDPTLEKVEYDLQLYRYACQLFDQRFPFERL